jgi:hypothetical protein
MKNKFFIAQIIFALLATQIFAVSFVSAKEKIEANFDYVPGEILVSFHDSDEFYKIKIDENVSVDQAITEISQNKNIEHVVPNHLIKLSSFPNDPMISQQTYLTPINAKPAWSRELLIREQEKNNIAPVIAILDTGVDTTHPDLKDKIWKNGKEINGDKIDNDRNGFIDDVNGWNFVETNNNPNPVISGDYSVDAVNHGTIVAGVAAASANNGVGIAGVGWFIRIMPLRVLDSNGSGDVATVLKALDYAIKNGADVINMSFVGAGYNELLSAKIKEAYQKNIVVVAAAGNTDPSLNGTDLDSSPSYPVCHIGDTDSQNIVIGVASVDRTLIKSRFSNYGNCIDLVAPGEEFYTTLLYRPDNSDFNKAYGGYWDGTSLAAPVVSAAFATLKGLRPAESVDALAKIMLDSADSVDQYNLEFKGKLGKGIINMDRAVETLISGPTRETGLGESLLIAGLGYRSFPQIKVLRSNGEEFKSFFAYSPTFNGPIITASGDVIGNNENEIVTVAGFGGGPHVRVFNIEGQLVSQFFAYDKSFRGGLSVAVGDITGDGKDEIIVGVGRGGLPEVKVFTASGELIKSFLAYDKNFRGGVNVAVGDTDRDGELNIITGAGQGGGPHVRIFNANGDVVNQFFAYNQNFRGGVNVAMGDIHGDGQDEITVSVENNSLPTVRIFASNGTMLHEFIAFEPAFTGGVNVAMGDINQDGRSEIIVGMANGGRSLIRVFDRIGNLITETTAHSSTYRGGVRPSVFYR